ncbi:MAG: hypothetical protein ROO76_00980 [Terriglobia bacterium]|nr:hypothetical protein [Terriglobia bacterium]
MDEDKAKEAIYGLKIGVHTSEDVLDDEGSFSSAQSCMQVGNPSPCFIHMYGTYIGVCEFISQRSQRLIPISLFERGK